MDIKSFVKKFLHHKQRLTIDEGRTFDEKIGSFIQKTYNFEAKNYRNISDIEVENIDTNKIIKKGLTDICLSFNKSIDVLDLCCGTGRYFETLKNVATLVGVDFSYNMIREALNPHNKSKIDIQHTRLIVADIHTIDTLLRKDVRFDFIYSIGSLAAVTAINVEILNKIYDRLKDGGKIYLTVLEKNSSPSTQAKEVLLRIFFTLGFMHRKLVFTKFAISKPQLTAILKESKFKNYQIESFADAKHSHNVIIGQKTV